MNPPILTCTGSEIYVNDEKLMKNQSRILIHRDMIQLKAIKKEFRFIDRRSRKLKEFTSNVSRNFFIGKVLGSGFNGDVCLAYNAKTLKKYAIKTMRLNDDGEDDDSVSNSDGRYQEIQMEIAIMKGMQHQNILKLIDVFHDDEKFHLLMEFCNRGSLFNIIVESKHGRLSEHDSKDAIHQTAKGLKHLHEHNFAHLDLKPENVLAQEKCGRIIYKIGDFGFSVKDVDVSSMCGTPKFMAPERFNKSIKYFSGSKSDMWSLGVSMYNCLAGCDPFPNFHVRLQICNAKADFSKILWKHISSEATDLIDRLMTVDPDKRMTSKNILEHPWFAEKKLKNEIHRSEKVPSLRPTTDRRLRSVESAEPAKKRHRNLYR